MCDIFCRCASGPGERGETEVQTEVGCREQRLSRPHHPPSSQKAMWVTQFDFSFLYLTQLTVASSDGTLELEKGLIFHNKASVSQLGTWIHFTKHLIEEYVHNRDRNICVQLCCSHIHQQANLTASLNLAPYIVSTLQIYFFINFLLLFLKFCICCRLKLSHTFLSPFLHPSFPPFSDEDRFPSVGGGAREDLCHAWPHHARWRHQGPDHTVWLGRPRTGCHHRLGKTYPR